MTKTPPRKKAERPFRQIRRDRLGLLISEVGSAKELSERTRTPESYISAMKTGERGIGDDVATKFEAAMHKPVGWMDLPLGAEPHSRRARQTPGQALQFVAQAAERLQQEARGQLAQLAAMLVNNGPSEPLAAAVDELTAKPALRVPTNADVESNRIEKLQQWEELVRSMGADLSPERRAEFDKAIEAIEALRDVCQEQRNPVVHSQSDGRARAAAAS